MAFSVRRMNRAAEDPRLRTATHRFEGEAALGKAAWLFRRCSSCGVPEGNGREHVLNLEVAGNVELRVTETASALDQR